MKEYFVPGVLNAVSAWVEENGVFRTSVISDGTGGEAWIDRLERGGRSVSSEAKTILRSSFFTPTFGVETELAVFRSTLLPIDERYTINAHEEALLKGLVIPDIEVTCLLCEKISKELLRAMGFWWIAIMHAPVRDFENNPLSLCVDRYGDEEWVYTHGAKDYDSWDGEGGFAFEIPS